MKLRTKRILSGITATVIVLGLGGHAIVSNYLPPCFLTYRGAHLDRAACLAAYRHHEDAQAGRHAEALKGFEADWARGNRRDYVLTAARSAAELGDAAQTFRWLDRLMEAGGQSPQGLLQDDSLAKVRAMPRFDAWLERYHQSPLVRSIGTGLGRAPLASAGFDPAALDALLARAKETESSALVLVKDGAIVGEWYWDGGASRTETMSATKAIGGLALGILAGEGRISGPDEPLARHFPGWSEGLKAKVTVRHLLTHTSGLKASRSVMDFIWRENFVETALEADVVTEPGSTVFYNNKATNLVSALVAKTAGKPLDAYLDEKLFTPMGIRDWDWMRDPAGNPHGMSGFLVHPQDLAKLGVLLAQGGQWQGQQLLPAGWLEEATRQTVPAAKGWGFLFRLQPESSITTLSAADLTAMEKAGVDRATIESLTPLRDRPLDSRIWLLEALRTVQLSTLRELKDKKLIPDPVESGIIAGFSSVGSAGIHLTVFPEQGLVAVRMAFASDEGTERLEFIDFPSRVQALLPVKSPAAPR